MPELSVVHMESPTTAGSAEPNLFTSSDGRVILSWIARAETGAAALRFSTFEDGSWSQPRDIVSATDLFVNWADFPSVIELGDGRLLAHWLQRNGTATYAYEVRLAESRDNGETWSESTTPHVPGIEAEHGFVSMLPAGDSDAGILFLNGGAGQVYNTGPQMHLAYATWGSDGSVTSHTIVDERVCDCCQTALAITPSGPVAAYRDRTESEYRDISIVRLVNGTWTEPKSLHADGWNVTFCPVNGPSLSSTGDTVAAAWFTAANDSARVQIAFSEDAAENFGAPIRIDDGNPIGRVDIELLNGRTAFVSWLEQVSETEAETRGRIVLSNGTMGASIVVSSTPATRRSGFPRVTRVREGLLAAWTVPGESDSIKTAIIRTDWK